jgi:hypothetical protein
MASVRFVNEPPKASSVLGDPMTASISPDEQAGQAGAAGGSDILLDHEFFLVR